MFKSPFSFNGRIKRTEFAISYIGYWVVYVFIRAMLSQESRSIRQIGVVLFIPLGWFLLAQGAKRCHDISKNGWWQIIPFYFLWLIFESSYPGPNQYDIGHEVYSYGANDYEKPFMIDGQNEHEMPIPGNLKEENLP